MNVELHDRFLEFARLKLAADGSDAYIMGAVVLALESDDPHWYAGCFTTPYAPPTQEVLVRHWTRHDLLEREDLVLEWTIDHWSSLPISGARRTNRMGPHKLVRTLAGWARWLDSGGIQKLDSHNFDTAFKQLTAGAPNHGRYTGLKLYETLRRIGADIPTVGDIRPRGGRVPRRSLREIFGHDHRSDDAATAAEANALADRLRNEIPTSWFNAEMLLCNFRKAMAGGFYPGYATDKELERAHQVAIAFGDDMISSTLRVRRLLYPPTYLGEVGGWSGTRMELGRALPDHGYFWSDGLFDYAKTTDLARPAERSPSAKLPFLRGVGEE